jgi:hypothetical protein
MMNTVSKDYIVRLLATNDKAIGRALLALRARQTLDEQAAQSTRHHNAMGFRPCDARMGTSMANFYQNKGYLSTKQLAYWRRPTKTHPMRIAVYANQLVLVAEERAQTVAN